MERRKEGSVNGDQEVWGCEGWMSTAHGGVMGRKRLLADYAKGRMVGIYALGWGCDSSLCYKDTAISLPRPHVAFRDVLQRTCCCRCHAILTHFPAVRLSCTFRYVMDLHGTRAAPLLQVNCLARGKCRVKSRGVM